MTKEEKLAIEQKAINDLRSVLKPGDTIYTILVRVSRSGMSRVVRPVIVRGSDLINISRVVARAGIAKLARDESGIVIGGCGMDTGDHLVYCIGRALYPDGVPCTGDDRCISNDHFNERPNSVYSTERIHKDGGYAFKQRWI